jgi:GTP diphosphokinase / guanosine-3',5'-bis(diphosphate) 3'-diphosphatase
MRQAGMSLAKLTKNEAEVSRVCEHLGFGTLDELMLQVGYGRLDSEQVIGALREDLPRDSEPPPELRPSRLEQFVRRFTAREPTGIRVSGIDDVLVRYARCCNPLPGDAIIGFITRGRGVTIHRRECQKALDTDPERRIDVEWDTGQDPLPYTVRLKISVEDRRGILADVSSRIADIDTNIKDVEATVSADHRGSIRMTVEISDVKHLERVMKSIRNVEGVLAVERATR